MPNLNRTLDKGYWIQDLTQEIEETQCVNYEYPVLTHHGSTLNPELPVSDGVCFKQSHWEAGEGGTWHMGGGQDEGGHSARTRLMRLGLGMMAGV